MWHCRSVPSLPESLTLRHGNVVLRDWREDDAPDLEPICGDPDVCQFTSIPWTFTEPAARDWIRRLRARRSAGECLALAITRAGDGAALGNVNLLGFSDHGRGAALGYWLMPAARGQGLALAAAELLCGWGFEEMNLARIELAILPHNVASHRVAERLGAQREGIRFNSHEAFGRTWDMVIYSLFAPPAR